MSGRLMFRLEKWFGDKDFITFLLRDLRLIGLWPIRPATPQEKLTILRRGWIHFEVWFLTAILIVLSPITIYYNWGVDLRITSEIADFMFAIGLTIVHIGSLLYRGKYFERMFDALEAMKTLGSLHQSQPKEVIEVGKKLSMIALVYHMVFSFILIITTVLGMPIYCFRRREFVIRFWFPYDYKTSPYFELTITVLLVTFIYGFHVVNTVNALLLSIFAQTAFQLTLLNHNIASISNVARTLSTTKKVEEDKSKNKLGLGPKLSETQPNVIPEKLSTESPQDEESKNQIVLNVVVAEDHIPNIISTVERSRKVVSATEKVDNEAESQLQHCVKHHQAITSFIPEIQAAFGPVIFIQFMCITCPVIIAFIIILQTEIVDEKTYFILALISTLMIQQGCISYLAEKVTNEGENVRDSVYSCDWLCGSESFKRSMRIMMSRSNQLLIVKPVGIPLTLESFFEVMKIAFNFYKSLSAILDTTLEDQT